jgi:hypothetical protein
MKSFYLLLFSFLGLSNICFADYSIRGIQSTCPNTEVTYYFSNSDTKNTSYDITVSQEGIIVEYQNESGKITPVAASTQTRTINFSDTQNQATIGGNGCYVKVLWGNFRGSLATINGGSNVPTYIPWNYPRQEETLNVQIGSPDITGTIAVEPATTTCDSKTIGFSIPVVAGATSYNWQNSFGWRLSGSMINGGYAYGYFDAGTSTTTSGQVTVTAINSNCFSTNSTKTFLVTRGPGIHYIDGLDNMPGGTFAQYSGPVGCSNYSWSVPNGWSIIEGHGTSSIKVQVLNGYYQGNISLSYTDICGQRQVGNKYVTSTYVYDPGPFTPGTQDRRANPGSGTAPTATTTEPAAQSVAPELAIYPNPVTSELKINANGEGSVGIYNSVGALVREAHIAEGIVSISINTLDLPNGNYHVRLTKKGITTLDKQVSIIH